MSPHVMTLGMLKYTCDNYSHITLQGTTLTLEWPSALTLAPAQRRPGPRRFIFTSHGDRLRSIEISLLFSTLPRECVLFLAMQTSCEKLASCSTFLNPILVQFPHLSHVLTPFHTSSRTSSHFLNPPHTSSHLLTPPYTSLNLLKAPWFKGFAKRFEACPRRGPQRPREDSSSSHLCLVTQSRHHASS